jgi:hypothetical protein
MCQCVMHDAFLIALAFHCTDSSLRETQFHACGLNLDAYGRHNAGVLHP